MPSATPELQARFPGGLDQAIRYLEKRGFLLTEHFTWITPLGRMPSIDERDAVLYLIQEWDFGGFETEMVRL